MGQLVFWVLGLFALVVSLGLMYTRACEAERQRIGGHRFTLLVKPSLWQALFSSSSSKSLTLSGTPTLVAK